MARSSSSFNSAVGKHAANKRHHGTEYADSVRGADAVKSANTSYFQNYGASSEPGFQASRAKGKHEAWTIPNTAPSSYVGKHRAGKHTAEPTPSYGSDSSVPMPAVGRHKAERVGLVSRIGSFFGR